MRHSGIHTLSLGGAVVMTVYKHTARKVAATVPSDTVSKITRLGYNLLLAVEAKSFTIKSVLSKKPATSGPWVILRREWLFCRLFRFLN
jgi:hypothetical protein